MTISSQEAAARGNRASAETATTAAEDVNRDFAAARDSFVRWITDEAFRLTSPRALVRATCERLLAHGVPLHRFTAFIFLLHPNYFGVAHRWARTTGKVDTTQGSHETFGTDLVQKSPIAAVFDGVECIRRRLTGPDAQLDFDVLADYRDEGATDYVLMRLEFTDGSKHTVTLSTDAPGGFTTAQLCLIRDGLPHLARLTEIQANRYLATTLLDTYVGHDAGARILDGTIRRGSGQTMHAVIWMCDMRRFTELSTSLPRDAMLDTLNAYFDCVGEPIATHGGEILKFIGDAVLAVWPAASDPAVCTACGQALVAAQQSRRRLAELNAERADKALPPIDFGTALHVGDVMYGNIGTGNRLDFTVIGSAVNLVARIAGLCATLGEPVLTSRAFADANQGPFESLGCHPLKGVPEPTEIFRPQS